MKHRYTHPATSRRTELIRHGWSVIAKEVSLDELRKASNRREYPEGAVWLTTGEVFAPPAKRKSEAA